MVVEKMNFVFYFAENVDKENIVQDIVVGMTLVGLLVWMLVGLLEDLIPIRMS